ncbi:MAG: hypothetical protein U0797_04730 [Gemmataceae bacterium]
MKSAKRPVVLFCLVAVAAAAVLASRGLCRCHRGGDRSDWRLPQLVEHLNGSGLRLKVVPSRRDGRWDDTVYLTRDHDATWETFQRKNLTAERLSAWQGSVYAHRIGSRTDLETHLVNWQGQGVRAGNFLLFGDPALLERIRHSLGQSTPGECPRLFAAE